MTNALYPRLRATADRLLSSYGGTAVLRRMENVGTPWDPTLEPVDYPCTLMQGTIDMTNAAGTLIEATDRQAIIAASDLPFAPTTADKLVVGGVEHALKSVQPLQPDPTGSAVLYEVVFVG